MGTKAKNEQERGCVADQPQHSNTIHALRLVEDDTAALRLARPEIKVVKEAAHT